MSLKLGKAASGPPAKFLSAAAAMLLQTETDKLVEEVCVCLPEIEKLLKKKKERRGGAEPVTGKCWASFLSHLYTCVNKIGDSRPTTFRTTLHPSREGILVPH